MAFAAPLVIGAIGAWMAPVGYAALGWAIGSTLGQLLVPKPNQKVSQQPLTDLTVLGTDYGQPIPWVQGHPAIAGQMWWNTDRRPIATTTSSGGGKGGGGSVESTTYTYDMDCLIGLSDNEIAGISRIWKNGKLVWTNLSLSSDESLVGSSTSELWTRLDIYKGTTLQEADPTYQAALLASGDIVDAADAPAYRGRAYVFIEGLQLGGGGQIPNLVFELQSKYNAPNITFSPATLPSSSSWAYGLGYLPWVDRWVAHAGGAGPKAYSDDGCATWQSGSGGTVGGGPPILAVNDVAAVTGYNGGRVARTTDGIVWTDGPNYGFASHGLYALGVMPNGNFLIADGVGAAPGRTWGSADGETWANLGSMPGTGNTDIQGVCSDGSSITIAYAGRVGVASNKAWYSLNNGASWTAYDLPTTQLWNMCIWNGSVFMLFCTSSIFLVSETGLPGSWTQKATLPFSSQWTWGAALRGGATLINDSGNDGYVTEDNGDTWTFVDFTVNSGWRAIATDGYRWAVISTSDNDLVYSNGVGIFDLNNESVADVVARLCRRAGLADDQFDVSGLESITREVRALAVSQIAPPRQAIDLLAAAFFFEYTVADKIYFVPRGGSSVATIPYLDLGASAGDEFPEPFAPREQNEVEIPARIVVSYINVDDDYQPGAEASDRLVSAVADSEETVQMAIGLTPDEAKQIADVMLLDRAVARVGSKIALLGNYSGLLPSDVVTVTAEDGSTFRMRIVQANDSFPLLEFNLVLDDATILTSQGITSADYSGSTEIVVPVDTVLALMDMPILRDSDDDAGFYLAARGEDTPYPGASILKSHDQVEFTNVATVTESGVLGICTTTLGDWDGPPVFDEANSFTVDLGPNGTLSSSTNAALIADESVNAALVGHEVIQFRTATLVSPGVYTLSGLLRGLRGTEWAMTGHGLAGSPLVGEDFVLLRLSGLRRVQMTISELGDEKYYKGVTFGRALSTAETHDFTNNGVGLKPFSVTHLTALVDVATGDVVVSWERRTRLSARGISTIGQSIPLGEESEAYEVDVTPVGSPSSVVRTLSASTNSVRYTAAMQSADGLSPGSITYTAYQISATVGRGYPTEITA